MCTLKSLVPAEQLLLLLLLPPRTVPAVGWGLFMLTGLLLIVPFKTVRQRVLLCWLGGSEVY